MNCTRSLLLVVSGWVPRHVIGAVLVSLPAISVLSHLTCSVQLPLQVNMSVGGSVEKKLGNDCVCEENTLSRKWALTALLVLRYICHCFLLLFTNIAAPASASNITQAAITATISMRTAADYTATVSATLPRLLQGLLRSRLRRAIFKLHWFALTDISKP